MHPGATLFYKCRFETEPDTDMPDPLWTIVYEIRKWMCAKHPDLPADIRAWTAYVKNGGCLDTPKDTREPVHVRSQIFQTHSTIEWACQIDEVLRGALDEDMGGRLAPRTWTMEIGYQQKGGQRKGRFSMLVSYYDQPGYVGRSAYPAYPSIPRLVRRLTANPQLYCNVSGMPISNMLLPVGDRQVLTSSFMFWNRVTDPDREYPIIYLGRDPHTGICTVDCHEVNDMVFPNALVCYPIDADADRRIRDDCPVEGLQCPDGGLRFYTTLPQLKGDQAETDIKRHRYLNESQIAELRRFDAEEGMSDLYWGGEAPDRIVLMMRQAVAQDISFAESDSLLTVEKVRVKREMADAERRNAQAKQTSEDAKQRLTQLHDEMETRQLRDEENARKRLEQMSARQRAASATVVSQEQQIGALDDALRRRDEELDEQRAQIAQTRNDANEALTLAQEIQDQGLKYKEQNDELMLRTHILQAKLDAMSAPSYSGNHDFLPETLGKMFGGDLPTILASDNPRTNGEHARTIVTMFAQLFPERIIVTDRARQSLRACVTRPALVWQGMAAICLNLYEVYRSEQGSGNISQRFRTMPGVPAGFEVALHEGKETRKDPKLVTMRELVYSGGTISIEPHLKYGHGRDDSDSLRIYYGWDPNQALLVIGHIGRHLTNYTSKVNKMR
jgi:hypothetical protein